VVLAIESPQKKIVITANYLIGCDGAHSTIRKQLKLRLEQLCDANNTRDFFSGPMRSVCFRSDSLSKAYRDGVSQKKQQPWMHWIVNSDRRCVFLKINGFCL